MHFTWGFKTHQVGLLPAGSRTCSQEIMPRPPNRLSFTGTASKPCSSARLHVGDHKYISSRLPSSVQQRIQDTFNVCRGIEDPVTTIPELIRFVNSFTEDQACTCASQFSWYGEGHCSGCAWRYIADLQNKLLDGT